MQIARDEIEGQTGGTYLGLCKEIGVILSLESCSMGATRSDSCVHKVTLAALSVLSNRVQILISKNFLKISGKMVSLL